MTIAGLLLSVELWIGLFTVAVSYWIIRWMRQPKNLPPGPVGLPIIGASYLLTSDFHVDFVRLGKKYGDVFSLYLGTKLTVVINDCDIIKETFGKGDDFADRIMNDGVPQIWHYRDELFHCPISKRHTSEKKFALQALRSFGMTRIEDFVAPEIDIIARHFQENKNNPVKPMMLIRRALTNTIYGVVCSTKYETGDPEREKIIGTIQRLFKSLSDAILLTAKLPVPLVRLFHPKEVKDAAQSVEEFVEITAKKIKEHQETFDPNNPRDVIDFYLQGGKYEQFGERLLAETVSLLQMDAMETLVLALLFAIEYTVAHPEVQSRIQREIDDVVGRSRLPNLNDRQQMPFTEATIWEALRLSAPFPFTLYHTALRDTTVKGFHVPEGTQVIANIYGVHMDPEIFPEPEKFMPERFLDKDGQLSGTNKLIPFSLGRRKCAGDQISMAQLFLFLTGIYQKFNLAFPQQADPSGEPTDSVASAMLQPTEYQVVPSER